LTESTNEVRQVGVNRPFARHEYSRKSPLLPQEYVAQACVTDAATPLKWQLAGLHRLDDRRPTHALHFPDLVERQPPPERPFGRCVRLDRVSFVVVEEGRVKRAVGSAWLLCRGSFLSGISLYFHRILRVVK
jgi:hypothetical protein